MCRVSGRNVYWCWRYASGRTNLGRTDAQMDGRTDGAKIIIPHQNFLFVWWGIILFTSISLTQWYPPPGKNSVVSSKDSWEDWSKCMCKLSETNIHWCLRYSSRRIKFSNILSIWANKNDEKSTILNLILTKLHRIHGRIVVNAYVKYWKPIFINVGDIHPDGQNFEIFCQFEQTKMMRSQPF